MSDIQLTTRTTTRSTEVATSYPTPTLRQSLQKAGGYLLLIVLFVINVRLTLYVIVIAPFIILAALGFRRLARHRHGAGHTE